MANFVQEEKDRFSYVYSCDLDFPFRIKIGTLEGQRRKKSVQELLADPQLQFSGLYQSDFSDLFVVVEVFANGKRLSLPSQTAYKSFSNRWNWNEWVTLPIHFKDLPYNACLAFTIYDIYGPQKVMPVGGTTMPIFGKRGCLRKGIHDLRVWPDVVADGSMSNSTPGEIEEGTETQSEMVRLSKLVQKHRKGRMMTVDWLDRLTFREIEVINEREKRCSKHMFLTIEFPKFHYDGFEHAVVYFESDGELPEAHLPQSEFRMVLDPDRNLENLVERKHHFLTHTMRKGHNARDLKPNAKLRAAIMKIVNGPPTQTLDAMDKSLIWMFRYSLVDKKAALPKFLRSVSWDVKEEADEALDLMYKWAPLDPVDTLELLTPAFREVKVRRYAISRLQCADNEELLLYLLQLVQALRYEDPVFINEKPGDEPPALSEEATFSEATKSRLERELAEAFMESEGVSDDSPSEELPSDSDSDSEQGDLFSQLPISNSMDTSLITSAQSSTATSILDESEYPDLSSFLIARACRSTQLASFFYWYLSVECNELKDNSLSIKYERIRLKFQEELKHSPRLKWQKRGKMIVDQELLVAELMGILTAINNSKDDRPKKEEKLRAILSSRPSLLKFPHPVRLPLDPSVRVTGVIADKASLFKSALTPAKVGFRTVDNEIYWVMFKLGDDLRQDQLVLQLISLMDRLLRRENLDLKLSPYSVLSCSANHGFVQLVQDTQTVYHVLATYKTIQNFFRQKAPQEGAPYGIQPEVMDTYVRSCAGYCVITYILGVGDRHMENLLLSDSGHLIHVDFGYMLGRDPKIFPPPMRLSKEMVEGMGGKDSAEYKRFVEHCYSTFTTLRRSVNLFLNLFSLMLDSGVPDIAMEPDKTVQKVEDKFCLEYGDEEALRHIQTLIEVSVKAVFAKLVERLHILAQFMRK